MYRKNNASLLYKKSDDNMSGHARMKDKEKLIKNKRMKNLDLCKP